MQYYGATPAPQWMGGGYAGYGYGQDYAPAPQTLAETTSTSPLAQAQSWWGSQSTMTKVAIGVGAAAVVGLIIYALMPGGATATPNKRRRKKRRYRPNLKRGSKAARKAAKKGVLTKIRGKRERAPRGKIISIKGGRRFGHLIPPKRYYSMGAKRPSDYAYPEGYKYPLVFRTSTGKVNIARTMKHIKNAKSRFSKDKHLYPMSVRREIARNINRANKRFNVGGKIVKP